MAKFLPFLFLFQLLLHNGLETEALMVNKSNLRGSPGVWIRLKEEPSSVRYLYQTRPENCEHEVERWVVLLESECFHERNQAEMMLLRKGPGIIPALKRCLPFCKPEATLRIQRIIRMLWLSAW